MYMGIYINHTMAEFIGSHWRPLKTESRHDTNIFVTSGIVGCLMTTSSVTSDDKVGIMATRGFQWPTYVSNKM